mmetsp:Transcript_5326/g.16286  ORF Transcript_5326/g.16286 Transcript_5326/m.16286 type:complete len:257 (-) Transcript_5326:2160-2930(-)
MLQRRRTPRALREFSSLQISQRAGSTRSAQLPRMSCASLRRKYSTSARSLASWQPRPWNRRELLPNWYRSPMPTTLIHPSTRSMLQLPPNPSSTARRLAASPPITNWSRDRTSTRHSRRTGWWLWRANFGWVAKSTSISNQAQLLLYRPMTAVSRLHLRPRLSTKRRSLQRVSCLFPLRRWFHDAGGWAVVSVARKRVLPSPPSLLPSPLTSSTCRFVSRCAETLTWGPRAEGTLSLPSTLQPPGRIPAMDPNSRQ